MYISLQVLVIINTFVIVIGLMMSSVRVTPRVLIDLEQVCRSSLLSGRNVRWPRRMLAAPWWVTVSRPVPTRQTDGRTLDCYITLSAGHGQRNNAGFVHQCMCREIINIIVTISHILLPKFRGIENCQFHISHVHLAPPLGLSRWNCTNIIDVENHRIEATMWRWLLGGRLSRLAQYQRVTYGRTYRQTDRVAVSVSRCA